MESLDETNKLEKKLEALKEESNKLSNTQAKLLLLNREKMYLIEDLTKELMFHKSEYAFEFD